MPSLIDYVLQNNLEGLQAELSLGANSNLRDQAGRTALIHAAIDNRCSLAELLVNEGAMVDAKDGMGNSALHYAAQNYHIQMAKLLIGNGAQIDIEDNYGNTPLWRAVFNSLGRGELITILIIAGADKNHRNKNGKTPIDLATTIVNYDILRFLNRA